MATCNGTLKASEQYHWVDAVMVDSFSAFASNSKWRTAPIVVGGVGGSGTRIVANMLRAMGLYVGAEVNQSTDNLWYTFLLLHTEWLWPSRQDANISIGIELFRRAMTEGLNSTLSDEETAFLRSLRRKVGATFHGRQTDDIVASLYGSNAPTFSAYKGWGWKEPNTHILIDKLAEKLYNINYVHVIRNGIDIALSSNQNQLRNWGSLFGISAEDGGGGLASHALEYWIRANARAVTLARQMLGQRFLLVDYYDLCLNPQKVAAQLASMAELGGPGLSLSALARCADRPVNRTDQRKVDAHHFERRQLQILGRLGYHFETLTDSTLKAIPERCTASECEKEWVFLIEDGLVKNDYF